MAVMVQMLVFGITLFYVPIIASPTSWFYNAPRALFGLASSASASASAPATPASYIADLRRKQEKSEELQNDKGLSEQADLLDGSIDKNEGSGSGDEETEGNNEASPSLLQKKVSKILTKLRLIAQIKNAYHYKPEEHEHETNITFDIHGSTTTPKTNETQQENIKEDTVIEPRITTIKLQSKNIQSIQPASSYGVPKESIKFPTEEKEDAETEPIKIELDVNQIHDKLEEFNPSKKENIKENDPGRFGTLGVFFAELLGSIIGLTYGAVAQITSGGQSPAIISTSEGV